MPTELNLADGRTIVVKERFDCFRGTSKERVANKYGVVGVNVYARKPC